MTKRQRTLLFFLIAGLFLATAPVVALYSQGYRVDLENRQITQTGAFFIKAKPGRVSIAVDGRPVKTTEYFFDSALTKNFLPGSHRITVSKEGFIPWEKTLELKERQVTEAKFVVLFPENLEFQAVQGDVERVWMAPDRTRAVLLQRSASGRLEARYHNLKTGAQEVLWRPATPQERLQEIRWNPDSKRLLLAIEGDERIRRVALHPEENACPGQTCSLDFLGFAVGDVHFAPGETRLVVQRQLGSRSFLQEADYGEQRALSFWGDGVVASTVAGDQAFWLNRAGALWQQPLAAPGDPTRLNQEPLPVRQETPYELFSMSRHLFVRQGGTLSWLAPDSQELRAITDNLQIFLPGPDNRKVALATSTEVMVLYLEDQAEQPKHQRGDQVFLTRFSSPVSSLQWLTPFYLAFVTEDTVKAMEIDERDGLNIVDLGAFPDPELFWQAEEEFLYVFADNTLLASEKLIK